MKIVQLREDFDSGADVILTDEVSVHDVATILKEFFRDLPEPLLPREVYHPLLAVQSKLSRRCVAVANAYLHHRHLYQTLLIINIIPTATSYQAKACLGKF